MNSDLKSVEDAEDRFSQLPDGVLCDILLLLSTKEVARTCVLSTRWGKLFSQVPKLIANGINTDLEENQAMFRLINRWIMTSEEISINEFILRSKLFPADSVFHVWLTTLLFHRIKVLELISNGFMAPPRLVYPPEDFFRSETLAHLRISGDRFVLKIPGFIRCPSLKTLHLEELVIENESGDFRFADAGYPQLKEFCLKGVSFLLKTYKEDVNLILTISLETLEKLVVDIDWEIEFTDWVDIDTQHLKHFQFTVKEDTEVNFSRCESLVYADIYQFSLGESYIKLLSQINNVKMLRLSDQDYTGFAAFLPQFIHLTHLKLRLTAHKSVWCLLQHAPNLEVLDYQMSSKNEAYLPPEDVPHCLSHSLKEIRTTCFRWYEDDMDDDDMEVDHELGDHSKTVEYFLQHGAVLQRLSLGHSKMKTAEWRHSTLNLLQNIPRLSPHCQITLRFR